MKELWEVKPEKSEPGNVMHSIGWPLDQETYGGSFLYHLDKNLVSIGFVIGLDYKNPYLSLMRNFKDLKCTLQLNRYLMKVEEYHMEHVH